MPKRPQLPVGQKGSILILVLVFSIVLAMAAASLLLVAGNATNDEDAAFRRLRCANDAESGLMVGVGWLRNNNSNGVPAAERIYADQPLWPIGGLVLNLPDATFENGSHVTITIVDNVPVAPPNPPTGPKTIVSRAVLDDVIVQFSWDVDTANDGAGEVPPNLTLTNFRSP